MFSCLSSLYGHSVTKVAASLLSAVVIAINLYFVSNFVRKELPDHWAIDLAMAVFGILYLGFNLYLVSLSSQPPSRRDCIGLLYITFLVYVDYVF